MRALAWPLATSRSTIASLSAKPASRRLATRPAKSAGAAAEAVGPERASAGAAAGASWAAAGEAKKEHDGEQRGHTPPLPADPRESVDHAYFVPEQSLVLVL